MILPMNQDETSRPDLDLTGTTSTQESLNGSADPLGETAKDLESENAKNFQHALQIKQEKIKALEAKLREREEEEKEKKLAGMDEAERYRMSYEEEAQKRAKLELKYVISEATQGKSIPTGALEVLKEAPWEFPAIKQELSSEPTWDEIIDAVRRNIDLVADSLEIKGVSTVPLQETEPRKIDPERSGPTTISKERPLTREEIQELAKDPKRWEREKGRVLEQLARSGGVLQ